MKYSKKNFSLISGWGLNKWAKVKIFTPKNLDQLISFIQKSNSGSILVRGLGRSYGDASLLDGKNIICMKQFNKIELDYLKKTITVGAGITLREIIGHIVPKGFFLPVISGTSNITIGGAVASDIHGKNHYLDGSFGNHIKKISLIDGKGNIQELSPLEEEKKDIFWATIGGMGLTGAIFEVTINLLSISTSLINVDTRRFDDLDALIIEMEKNLNKYKYSVAWIDGLNNKLRGVLTRGDHLEINDLDIKEKKNPFIFKKVKYRSKPKFLTKIFLNKYTVKIFNILWFYKSPKNEIDKHESIATFFHPLDVIKDWNKIYGSKGFIQYQFFVPDHSVEKIKFVLNYLRKKNVPCFLTVLKKFGGKNPSLLSFPDKGWTLTTDIPNYIPKINKILDFLDKEIANSGGKIYLTKDSMQSAEIFKKTYPNFQKWKKIKKKLDPDFKFVSDLTKRLKFF